MNGRAVTGLVICGAGLVLTLVLDGRVLFYGAILGGAVMFIQGLAQGNGEGGE